MRMGLVIFRGTELEVKKEYDDLLEKAKSGFDKEIVIKRNEFKIIKSDISISFQISTLYNDEYAIFQIIK